MICFYTVFRLHNTSRNLKVLALMQEISLTRRELSRALLCLLYFGFLRRLNENCNLKWRVSTRRDFSQFVITKEDNTIHIECSFLIQMDSIKTEDNNNIVKVKFSNVIFFITLTIDNPTKKMENSLPYKTRRAERKTD